MAVAPNAPLWLCSLAPRLALTLAFEFLAGHYLFGTPWPVLLADYDILDGRIWPLVLLATFVAPALAARVRMS